MKKLTYTVVLWALCWTGAAISEAFPTWMGVYDYYQRHSGQNPGRFTILLNQDYFGLNASVGIQVNGGGWQEFPMAYVTNRDGNSVWTYVPTNAFPLGATVDFYFHGWQESTTANIYDSMDGANYHSGPLTWNAPESITPIPAYPGNLSYRARISADDAQLYLAAIYGSSPLLVSRRPFDRDWQDSQLILGDGIIDDVAVTATRKGAAVAFATNGYLYVRLSEDKGVSYSAPIFVTNLPAGATLGGLEIASITNETVGLVYGAVTNCCGPQQLFYVQSGDGGHTWGGANLIDAPTDFGGFFNQVRLAANAKGIYVAYRGVSGGSFTYVKAAQSVDGITWAITNFGGNTAWGDLSLYADSNFVYVASDPYYDSNAHLWRSTNGLSWDSLLAGHPLESGRPLFLGKDWQGNLDLFRMEDNDAGPLTPLMLASRVSTNNGSQWSDARPVYWLPQSTPTNDTYTLQQVLTTPQKLYLLWNFNLYVNTFQRMYMTDVQASDGFIERMSGVDCSGGQVAVSFTNLLGGLTYTLQRTPSLTEPAWTNLVAGVGTNSAGSWQESAAGQPAFYRVQAPYAR